MEIARERLRKTERKRAVSGFAVIQSEGWSERLDGVVLRDFLGFLQGGFWWVQRILLAQPSFGDHGEVRGALANFHVVGV